MIAEDYLCLCGVTVWDDPDGYLVRNAIDGELHICQGPKPVTQLSKEQTMNNSIKIVPRPQSAFTASALKIGEYARVTPSHSGDFLGGDIVLKTASGLVNISRPSVRICDTTFAFPAVERLNTGDKIEITVGFTTEFDKHVLEILKSGNKINAIKYVRECSNWGLKESKDYVDNLNLRF